ncbi:MAG: hypothetical protein COT88_00670 [Candidatus Colwellbacteria bacterium CG10_big_fil_rev_8_21_14_0_10_41_28]|uniref:YebC/PmpR family DNA-binding transcriptional regulator n=1 Tax=Candidatus Colwellbacteria bacterium CG10_big_fil_rev_8_21_14_0_10_41_28 TaxID=1974539 RepID=A0A2H0VHP2_9BACT|nr:MAG: hypothetical protein COT88_00670 [Candidatus Colwellbacteria bacterium CG10_big_fil_rev_8_21_14_0_10_41_28]
MSGHSKWKKIKHKKGKADQDRGKLFSKLANMITIAARENSDPDFNPTLRSAIDRAKKQNLPLLNIERAVNRAAESDDLEGVLFEAYGPDGVGLIIEAATDNTNRTVAEVRKVLKDHNAKIGDPGSLMWAFEPRDGEYFPKFPMDVSGETRGKIESLIEGLEDLDDVGNIYTQMKIE